VFKNVGRKGESTCWLLIWVANKYLSLQDPKIIFPLVMFVNWKDVRVFLLMTSCMTLNVTNSPP
jgi:hypothetical protein